MTAGNGIGIATSRPWTDNRRTRGIEHRFSDRLKRKLDVDADWIELSIHNAIVLRLTDTLARPSNTHQTVFHRIQCLCTSLALRTGGQTT